MLNAKLICVSSDLSPGLRDFSGGRRTHGSEVGKFPLERRDISEGFEFLVIIVG
jgi:hypothetical protein